MDFGLMVLLAFIFTISLCYAFEFMNRSNFVKPVTPDIPVTWNMDWKGGPGFDRFKILNEKGPYNPGGFT
jgi:hypothetical protein